MTLIFFNVANDLDSFSNTKAILHIFYQSTVDDAILCWFPVCNRVIQQLCMHCLMLTILDLQCQYLFRSLASMLVQLIGLYFSFLLMSLTILRIKNMCLKIWIFHPIRYLARISKKRRNKGKELNFLSKTKLSWYC